MVGWRARLADALENLKPPGAQLVPFEELGDASGQLFALFGFLVLKLAQLAQRGDGQLRPVLTTSSGLVEGVECSSVLQGQREAARTFFEMTHGTKRLLRET